MHIVIKKLNKQNSEKCKFPKKDNFKNLKKAIKSQSKSKQKQYLDTMTPKFLENQDPFSKHSAV